MTKTGSDNCNCWVLQCCSWVSLLRLFVSALTAAICDRSSHCSYRSNAPRCCFNLAMSLAYEHLASIAVSGGFLRWHLYFLIPAVLNQFNVRTTSHSQMRELTVSWFKTCPFHKTKLISLGKKRILRGPHHRVWMGLRKHELHDLNHLGPRGTVFWPCAKRHWWCLAAWVCRALVPSGLGAFQPKRQKGGHSAKKCGEGRGCCGKDRVSSRQTEVQQAASRSAEDTGWRRMPLDMELEHFEKEASSVWVRRKQFLPWADTILYPSRAVPSTCSFVLPGMGVHLGYNAPKVRCEHGLKNPEFCLCRTCKSFCHLV